MRKLATAALAFAAAIALAQYLLPTELLPRISALLAVLFVLAIFVPGRPGKRVRLIFIFSALGLLWSWAHHSLFIAPGEALAGEKLTVEARVTDFPKIYDSYSTVSIRLTGGDIANVQATLYAYDIELPELVPGDIISAPVSFSSATTKYNEETGRYTSKGVFALATLTDKLQITGHWKYSFIYFPGHINRFIKSTIAEIFPEDVLPFETALLTGDKSLLYGEPELNTAMGTAGILHVVSISGMHIAFLIGMVRSITGKRRRTALICVPLILIFIPMAGGGPSIVRAGVMQLMLLLAPLLRRENDSITSLSFVLSLLLLFNPASVQSVGLQLSFAAMSGILLVTPGVQEAITGKSQRLLEGRFGRAARFVISSLSSTVGALIFSTPIAAWHFGYVSLVSPLTNLLTLSVVSVCFTMGYLCCAAGVLIPALGTAMAWLLAWPLRYISFVVTLVAKIPYAAVYTSNRLIVLWLALTYLIIAICWLFRGKRGFRVPIPLGLSAILLVLALLATTLTNGLLTGRLTVLDIGQGQSIAAFYGARSFVIDCGGTGYGQAGATMSEFLLGQNRRRIDAVILTHLHRDHADGTAELISRLDVERLFIPFGDEDDDGLLPDILAAAEKHGTEIIYVAEDTRLSTGGLELILYEPAQARNTNERGVVVSLNFENKLSALVMGDINTSTELELLDRVVLPDVDLLVVGHHGSKHSTSLELLRATLPEIAVISSGYNNYGHPTGDVLYRLEKSGANILRTDQKGSMTFNIK